MEREKRHRAHIRNMEALETSFEVASKSCKESIRHGDEHEIVALTRTCALLLGATLEDRLMTIISSPDFPESSEQRVMNERTVLDMWNQVLVEAFAVRYKVPRSKVPSALPYTSAAYFEGMKSVIDDWMEPLINTRNCLAHGQWIVAFNEQRNSVNQDRTKRLHALTLWHLRLQKNMLTHLERLIFDLTVTRYAFERDFDRHWANLKAAQIRISADKSKEWELLLQRRHQRGKGHIRRNYRRLIDAGLI
ncbi:MULTISPECIES: hypothetical protein [unclassified Streptomyces]|uniref:hypothetical protein n=1 Tax=unclassified Streptomyces TaxID=2593676 RepID=UPI0011622ADC|nr:MULTISPECIES: hypothetical protein [unclassified Streptomyces]NMI60939.1 hypothetical protein [Streptomyces sp. RLA2-12]QDN60056.1 hypothetical protein FNV67_36540 [Streptomyces sp. S1D4-20]QDN70135.1 hypothetical protein FNV66_35555 [Streptomyces sp. S1D4-14]